MAARTGDPQHITDRSKSTFVQDMIREGIGKSIRYYHGCRTLATLQICRRH